MTRGMRIYLTKLTANQVTELAKSLNTTYTYVVETAVDALYGQLRDGETNEIYEALRQKNLQSLRQAASSRYNGAARTRARRKKASS